MPRGVTKRRPATVAALLDAAMVLFAEQGYGATSIPEICARAGLTKGAFYSNYPNKDALFLALLDRSWERRGGGGRAPRPPRPPPPPPPKPPPPPPPRPPPPPPKPPPPPPPRFCRSSASLTRSGRPARSAPFISAMAFAASAAEPMVTNAKPRDCPVSRSETTCTSVISPKGVNAARTDSAVDWKERFPT